MTLRTPPSWLQNGSHPAENDRLTMQAVFGSSGVMGATSLQVTQSSPIGMSVLMGTGWGSLLGNYTTNMGVYTFFNDAPTQLPVAAADPSNSRIDLVVVTVNDAYYTGTTNNVTFAIVTGIPAASPVAPATPSMSLLLAQIQVAAGATQILTANITDKRVQTTTNIPLPSSGFTPFFLMGA